MDMANCRFRHVLNVHCQIKVLEYLNLDDLLQVCKLDDYFKDLVMKWVIGAKLIKLDININDCHKMYKACEKSLRDYNLKTLEATRKHLQMFDAFGKSFRRLRVKGNDYNFILQNIKKYCSLNTLTELHIIVKCSPLNREKIDLPMALFTNLQKLRLEHHHDSKLFLEHLQKIADNALNLKILQVRGNVIQGEWLRTKNMQKLRELWLYTPTNISMNDLISFLRDRPQLKVFSFAGKEDITTIGESLSKYCSGLEKFCYEDLTVNQIYNYSKANPTNRFDFLSSLSKLDGWTLTSSSAFQYCFMALAANNVNELIIRTDLFSFRNRCKVKYIASLQTMKVELIANMMLGDGTTEQCEKRCNFIISFLSQLKTPIPNITLISERTLVGFYRILAIIPSNCTLSISNVNFKCLPLEMRKIVRTIRKFQQDRQHNQRLFELIVNEQQWRELKIHKGIESIMSILIDPNPLFN